MFKLGVISDEVSQDFQVVVNLASEFHLDSIEIRSVWDKPPQKLNDDDINRMRKLLEATNIKIIGVASPFYKCNIDNPDERKEHINILRNCIKLAKTFDASLIRCFTFWNTGKTEQVWNEILKAYEEPIKIASDEGVTIGIENEASTSVSTAKLLAKFLKDLNSPVVKAIWDPANELYAEGGEWPYPDGYQRIKHLMIHGHIKDGAIDLSTGKMESVPVGEGLVGWKEQFQAYIDDGYEGHLTLETHWRPKAKLSEDLLNRPGGSAFSEAGEEATRICLKNIRDLISELRSLNKHLTI